MKMIKAAIIGATGYAGAELYRLLISHPEAEVKKISSVSFTGKDIAQVYPSYAGIGNMILSDQEHIEDGVDVVFASLPHGLSQETAKRCIDAGVVFIDIGADFRLESEEEYKSWYGGTFLDPALHEMSVYGLPELNREKIRKTKLVANPGCYPTSVALGLYPALKLGLVKTDNIISDSKSGITGAGRGLTQNTHFPDANEAFCAYKVEGHRHLPEIEQTLSHMAGQKISITFVPHLLPVNRGILSTIYANKATDMTAKEIQKIYEDFYGEEPFVRVMPYGENVNIRNVRLSNFCDISIQEDAHTGRLIITSVIDNMVKGAAGQAIQNMNILFDLPETTGLMMMPPAF